MKTARPTLALAGLCALLALAPCGSASAAIRAMNGDTSTEGVASIGSASKPRRRVSRRQAVRRRSPRYLGARPRVTRSLGAVGSYYGAYGGLGMGYGRAFVTPVFVTRGSTPPRAASAALRSSGARSIGPRNNAEASRMRIQGALGSGSRGGVVRAPRDVSFSRTQRAMQSFRQRYGR